MILRIFTISGKLVKEFRKYEFGDVKIGNNLLDLTWDGRDEFGVLLANGVYIMKIDCKDNNPAFINNSKNIYMKNGFSKIVILR